MANTLTNLIPELYSNLDVVSRELVGMIPAVTLDATSSRASLNQTVRSFVAPASTARDITPGLYAPDDGDQVFTNKTLTISKSRAVPIRWNGNEEKSVGSNFAAMRAAQIQQAMRTLTNEIEADLAGLHIYASRAVGAAATTPFGTANDYTSASLTRKVLADNGAPLSDLQLVLNTAAGANIRGKQATAMDAGTDSILRQGVLLDINGMMIRESAQILTATAGTGSGATTNAAGYAVGATVITLASAGTGTLLAGDVITFAGDTNQYVITSGDADVSGGGTITLAAPGLRQAMSAATKAITVIATSARNMAFSKNAIVLAHRLPYLPEGGDNATDRTTITDPRSGLSFDVAEYRQYHQAKIEISCAWGMAVVKPEHLALLLG